MVLLAAGLASMTVLLSPTDTWAAGATKAAVVFTPQKQLSDPPPGQGLSAAVAAVPANSAGLDAARAEQKNLKQEQDQMQQDLESTDAEIQRVSHERESTTQLLARREQQVTKATASLDQQHAALRVIGVEWFITGFGRLSALNPTLNSADRDRLDRARVLSESAASSTMKKERFARQQLNQLQQDRSFLQEQLSGQNSVLTELGLKSQSLNASLTDLADQLVRSEERVAEERMSASIDGTDLSTGALDAYWRAASTLRLTNPSCAIAWWAIAGIGSTESKHGTYRGAKLGRDGQVSPPIYGPDLNGSNSFAIVSDSDGGNLDGTATTDRAVGPMQFLPSSWNAVARDATGDGVADPQNLYDAALTAGAYLCRKGPGLDQESTLRAAYLSYNRSQKYVDIVMSHALEYQRLVPLS